MKEKALKIRKRRVENGIVYKLAASSALNRRLNHN